MVASVAAFLAGSAWSSCRRPCRLSAGAGRHRRSSPPPGAILGFGLRAPVAVAGGFLWALAWVACCAPAGYDPAWDERDLAAEGVVASLPEARGAALRFEFLVASLSAGERQLPTPRRVRLSWRSAPEPVRLGERWRL